MLQYTKAEFNVSKHATIGVEFGTKQVTVKNSQIRAQIWDTAGQERYKAITNSYYRNAVGALLVFDLTCRKSFESCRKWFEEIREHAEPDIFIVLVGNKYDLADKRVIYSDEAIQFAEDCKIPYMETSALNGTNVNQAF
mmetsp:Transcript_75566/g.104546  ORF Transcript_75566/g.104546 Transcript_75566/m.104546 type:complete len:139 (+) Transcript_75566:111-527(+)